MFQVNLWQRSWNILFHNPICDNSLPCSFTNNKDSRQPLKRHSEILRTPAVYAKPSMHFLTINTCMGPLTTEVYGTDRDRFAAVDVFYTIIVVEHLNKSCKCCWNNCFGVINLSVNYSLMGLLLCIAFRAQAWHVRKPHWNALLSTQGMTTLCSVTEVFTGRIIRHAHPRHIGLPLCWVYIVTEQHLLINTGLGEGRGGAIFYQFRQPVLSIQRPSVVSESMSIQQAASRGYQQIYGRGRAGMEICQWTS